LAQELNASISFQLKVTVYTKEFKACSSDLFWKLPDIHTKENNTTDKHEIQLN